MAGAPRRSSPYQGLIPYTERDSVYFFGREKETRLIIANLFASPLTLLYGPSGVGKSSILRAGVVSDLRNRPNMNVVVHSDWKTSPLEWLKSLVRARTRMGETAGPPPSLAEFLGQAAQHSNTRLMLILDQFEEYFLYHPVEDDFTAQFSRAVMQAGLPVSFLISIREDSLAKLDRFEGRIPILFDNYLRLDHLDDAAARNAIEKPIGKFNELNQAGQPPMRIEGELVDEVLSQLKSGRVSLNRAGAGRLDLDGNAGHIETPYLQLVMTRIWSNEISARSNMLRLSTLKTLGGAEKIVRTHLDAVMSRLSSDHQGLAVRVFQFLVTPSGTKIALSANDLASYADAPPHVVQSLLKRLTEPDIRLLRTVETTEKGASYEIFHDMLASPILDWRERWLTSYRFGRRFTIIGMIVLLIFLILGGILWYLGANSIDFDVFLFCVGVVLIPGVIFGAIGFMTGINWARTK